MAICNVKHPIKDTVKADNSTYSSNKIESLIHSATELPVPTQTDNGKSIYVSSGRYTLKKNPEVWKVKKSGSSYYFEDTSVDGSNVVNYVMTAILHVVTGTEEIALRGEKFYIDASLGLPVARYSAITNDGTHTYYKYIEISVMASAPITGLTLNSVTIG